MVRRVHETSGTVALDEHYPGSGSQTRRPIGQGAVYRHVQRDRSPMEGGYLDDADVKSRGRVYQGSGLGGDGLGEIICAFWKKNIEGDLRFALGEIEPSVKQLDRLVEQSRDPVATLGRRRHDYGRTDQSGKRPDRRQNRRSHLRCRMRNGKQFEFFKLMHTLARGEAWSYEGGGVQWSAGCRTQINQYRSRARRDYFAGTTFGDGKKSDITLGKFVRSAKGCDRQGFSVDFGAGRDRRRLRGEQSKFGTGQIAGANQIYDLRTDRTRGA